MLADAEEENSDDDHGHDGNDGIDDDDQLRPTTVFFDYDFLIVTRSWVNFMRNCSI